MKTAVITLKEYQGFQKAYDFFNRELFAGSLPQVLVTLQRHANTRGYFSPERFKGRIEGIRLRRDSWDMTAVTQQCTACLSLAAAALEA
jgi:hypothetical protein